MGFIRKTLLLAVIAVVAGMPQLAHAENPAAQFLVETGENYYNKGDIENAIHEFSKALIIEPNNQQAIQRLGDLGVDKGLYSRQKTNTSQIADLATHIVDYREKLEQLELEREVMIQKVTQLQEQRNDLVQTNLAKNLEIDLLQDKVDDMRLTMTKQSQMQRSQVEQIEDFYQDRQQELSERLAQLRESGIKQELNLAEKNDLVALLNETVNKNVTKSIAYQQELMNMDEKTHDLTTKAVDAHFSRNRMYDVLEDYVYVRQYEVDRMEDDIILQDLALVQNQTVLLDRVSKYMQLDEKIQHYEHQLNSQQNLMQDKDHNITLLEKQLRDARSNLEELQNQIQQLIDEQQKILN